jgi:cysteine desulfurase
MDDARVYLDWNASAPLAPEARAAMIDACDRVGNPSSVHAFGRCVRRLTEQAREAAGALLGMPASAVIFVSGGTEANNLALQTARTPTQRLIGATEHASLSDPRWQGRLLAVDRGGLIDLDGLESALRACGPGTLISVQAANNETGVLQPIAAIAAIVHRYEGLLHVDAIQAAGRIPLPMLDWGADMVSLSAHKIGGPKGVGALVVAPRVPLSPLLMGGGQERGWRAGTENVPGIAGFGAACLVAAEQAPAFAAMVGPLRDAMEREALRLWPGAMIAGGDSPRVANTTCLVLPGSSAQSLLMRLDLDGIAVSAGAACSSGKVKPSHVLKAMGFDDHLAGAALRISLGWPTQAAETGKFLDALRRLVPR